MLANVDCTIAASKQEKIVRIKEIAIFNFDAECRILGCSCASGFVAHAQIRRTSIYLYDDHTRE